MKPAPKLRAVPDAPPEPPCTAYEHEQRRLIASRDWAAVHIAGDRALPINLGDLPRWRWR